MKCFKWVSGILVAALLLGLTVLAGAEPIELVTWYGLGGKGGEAYRHLVDEFNKVQSDIKITAHYQGSYFDLQQKLIAAVSAGSLPDIVNLEVTAVVPFARAGQLVNLEQFIDASYDLDDILPGLLRDGYIQGALYAMPLARSTPVLYYNKDMFGNAGLPDRAPENWTEFADWAKKLDRRDGKNNQYGFSHNNDTWSFEYMILTHGGRISDDEYNWHFASDANAIGAIEKLRDFFRPGNGGRFILRGAEVDAGLDFTTGRAAMIMQSTGSLVGVADAVGDKFEPRVGFIPMGSHRAVATGGNSLAIMSGISDTNKKAAWEFVKFMTTPEAVAQFSLHTGYMPLTMSASKLPAMQERYASDPNFEIAVQQLAYAVPQASYLHIPRGSAIIQEALQKIVLKDNPVKETLVDAANELTREARRGGFYR